MFKTWLASWGGKRSGRQYMQVIVEDSEIMPKSRKLSDSRKTVDVDEFAALARSSFYGISQAMKEHVTKPTSLAQGRIAHLIEWKSWPKTSDPAQDPGYYDFSFYCHLTEREQEVCFAAGVAEQFAIAEAKLRAWASVDDIEDDNFTEDSNNEDFILSNGHAFTSSSQSSGVPSLYSSLRRRNVHRLPSTMPG